MIRFGTDGVRGVANTELTPEIALSLGYAAGTWLAGRGSPPVVIGRDTRRSGSMLGAALASGFCSAGIDVLTLGVAPTPAVSFAVRSSDKGMGAVISASHNPAADNGIKLLGEDGGKLPEEVEEEIASLLGRGLENRTTAVGRITADDSPLQNYRAWLADRLPKDLRSLKIVVDCANGAASDFAPKLLSEEGAEVHAIAMSPDGDNINDGVGATRPSTLQKAVLDARADLGIAFDGDADRCVFCDETGTLINGDRFMAAWANFEHQNGRLDPPIVVGTVMSNLGFERALNARGVELVRTPVGDRHVANALCEHRARIGGEQSGHIIFPEHAPTGDGLLTAVEMIRVLYESGRRASQLEPQFENWPQVLVNVRIDRNSDWKANPVVNATLQEAQARIDGDGRILVRASGTQPVVRVMVESSSAQRRDEVAADVVQALVRECGGTVVGEVELTNALGD